MKYAVFLAVFCFEGAALAAGQVTMKGKDVGVLRADDDGNPFFHDAGFAHTCDLALDAATSAADLGGIWTVVGVGVARYSLVDRRQHQTTQTVFGSLADWDLPERTQTIDLDPIIPQYNEYVAHFEAQRAERARLYRICRTAEPYDPDGRPGVTTFPNCEDFAPRAFDYAYDPFSRIAGTIGVAKTAKGVGVSFFCMDLPEFAPEFAPAAYPLDLDALFTLSGDPADVSAIRGAAQGAVSTGGAALPVSACAAITDQAQCLATFPAERGGSSCGWAASGGCL